MNLSYPLHCYLFMCSLTKCQHNKRTLLYLPLASVLRAPSPLPTPQPRPRTAPPFWLRTKPPNSSQFVKLARASYSSKQLSLLNQLSFKKTAAVTIYCETIPGRNRQRRNARNNTFIQKNLHFSLLKGMYKILESKLLRRLAADVMTNPSQN